MNKLLNKETEVGWYEVMSYKMFLLAKETGIVITHNTNMVVVFDMLDNLDSYINHQNDESNK